MSKDEVQAVLLAAAELGLSERWRSGIGPEQLEAEASSGPPVPAANGAPAVETHQPQLRHQPRQLCALGQPGAGLVAPGLPPGLAGPAPGAWLFNRFPAGGYALSKALGVFLFAWLAYNLAWLRLFFFQFHQSHSVAAAGLLMGAVAAFRRHKEQAVAW